jgi:hypothetical protein
MLRRLIVLLIRIKLGVKKRERFRFEGQKSEDIYYFNETSLVKCRGDRRYYSGVSLNWLLNDKCKIERVTT